MGNWFSNINIRKNDAVTIDDVISYVNKMMALQQYYPAATEEEADGAFAIAASKDSQWFSLYSDLFSFDDPTAFSKIATPMSAELHTDVLGMFRQ